MREIALHAHMVGERGGVGALRWTKNGEPGMEQEQKAQPTPGERRARKGKTAPVCQSFLHTIVMGNFVSRIRLALRELAALIASYKHLSNRLHASLGIPVPNPAVSFWTVPHSPIAEHLSDLPAHVDIIILGITDASFARVVFGSDRPLHVDARDACSGTSGGGVFCSIVATRNVGHSCIITMAGSKMHTVRKWPRKRPVFVWPIFRDETRF